MKSQVVKRSIIVGGHKTSVSLEDAFWQGLKDIAYGRRATISGLISDIDHQRSQGNLSSTLRLFVLDHFRVSTPILAASSSTAAWRSRNSTIAAEPSTETVHAGDVA
jgi:predicted DNA-binding ribbon-helix-helix protein